MSQPPQLPPLPEPCGNLASDPYEGHCFYPQGDDWPFGDLFTADQMHAHAATAVQAALSSQAPANHGMLHETEIYDFAGWLTSRPGVMPVGSSSYAGPMAEAVNEYIKTYPERLAAPIPPVQPVPDVLFDGYAVLQALSDKGKARTSPENVSDVLDAVVGLIRTVAQAEGGSK